MKDWIKLKSLERELGKAERRHRVFRQSEKYKKLSSEERKNEEDVFIGSEYFPLKDQIEEIKSKRFIRRVEKYGIPYSQYWEKEGENFWQKTLYGTRFLTTKGYYELRKAIREEQKIRREVMLYWTPLVTVLTGLVGAIAAVLTILKYWGK